MQHCIAAKYAARPAARFVRASSRARERRLGLRAAATFRAVPPGRPCSADPARAAAPLRASWRSLQPARARDATERPAPARVSMRWSRPSGPAEAPLERRLGAVARLKQPPRPPPAASSSGSRTGSHSSSSARRRERDSLTWTLPKGTPHPGETSEETALREVAEETGLRSGSSSRSTRSSTLRPARHAHPQDRPLLPDGADRRRPGRHDHEFDEVRWVRFAEAGGVLTFETERALVAAGRTSRAGRRDRCRPPATPSARAGCAARRPWPKSLDQPVHVTP